MPSILSRLPAELLCKITRQLPPLSMRALFATCRTLHQLKQCVVQQLLNIHPAAVFALSRNETVWETALITLGELGREDQNSMTYFIDCLLYSPNSKVTTWILDKLPIGGDFKLVQIAYLYITQTPLEGGQHPIKVLEHIIELHLSSSGLHEEFLGQYKTGYYEGLPDEDMEMLLDTFINFRNEFKSVHQGKNITYDKVMDEASNTNEHMCMLDQDFITCDFSDYIPGTRPLTRGALNLYALSRDHFHPLLAALEERNSVMLRAIVEYLENHYKADPSRYINGKIFTPSGYYKLYLLCLYTDRLDAWNLLASPIHDWMVRCEMVDEGILSACKRAFPWDFLAVMFEQTKSAEWCAFNTRRFLLWEAACSKVVQGGIARLKEAKHHILSSLKAFNIDVTNPDVMAADELELYCAYRIAGHPTQDWHAVWTMKQE
eukprot:Colp12_sorted_trinity150504_noHs@10944